MEGLLHDAFGMPNDIHNIEETIDPTMAMPSEETKRFCKLLDDSRKPLYPGCKKFSKLSFLVQLLNIKCLGNMSDKTFTRILNLLREAFPTGVELPKSYYDTKKFTKEMGFSYDKYDACRNDCMIYWGVNKEKEYCDTCNASRWIIPEASNVTDTSNEVSENDKTSTKVAAKVGDDVLIKSENASKIVATGYVYGIDPSLEIGKQCLGPNWCEVNIQVAIESGEKLLRPHSNLKTIGDAYGSNIAWPCQLYVWLYNKLKFEDLSIF
ncbi:hypothetical protein ACJIZ3_008870 [Penstemon smallii]|uniref:Transposase Tnp1/En/Spm-like domain-containing protein n=1 Tax=Penstemon smallii TaxID=265156 RepID=A0ABD3TB22_9LAMI